MATDFQTTTGAPLDLPQWDGEVFQFEDVNQAFEKINAAVLELQENGGGGGVDTTVMEQLANRIYPGVDLTIKFAEEITEHGGDPWAWIKARITAVDYSGINIGDYIPFVANTNQIKAEVAGIDTYYNYGDAAVPHHIDFISRDCWPDAHYYNRVNYNNGTSVSPSPWLASDIYAWLNSLSRSVPNAATANPALVTANYTTIRAPL
ncbi:hypothetical protein LJC74_03065 [Eubacteriales bacterium OttesenSCG-928-A19]|nr:hypothetical protein [Eubacteriales bacterium OttesenSCG-928-A19]